MSVGTPPIERETVGDDAFFERLFPMLPSDVARSFNDAQLKAMARAFGTRRWRDRAVDPRWILPLFGRSYYFVLLAGAERRSRERRLPHPMTSIGHGIFAAVFFAGIPLSAVVSLYIPKSITGINPLPDMSLGVIPILQQEPKMLFG